VSIGNSVQPPTVASKQLSQAEVDEYLRYQKLIEYGLCTFAISDPSSQSRFESGPTASATVLNTSIAFLVDTGAPVNILDEATFSRIKGNTSLEECNIPIYGYGATQPLEIMGQFSSTVKYKASSTTSNFFVIKGREKCLMSYQTARSLGVILIDEGPSQATAFLRSTPTNISTSFVPIQPTSAERNQISNFVDTGVKLDAAIQRRVSVSNEIVANDKEGNAKATQPVEPPPITTPAPTAKPTAKLKRTMKQEAAPSFGRQHLQRVKHVLREALRRGRVRHAQAARDAALQPVGINLLHLEPAVVAWAGF
jgi:hypothetical protein